MSTLVCLSVFNPWVYNGIGGFKGFLFGSDTMLFFIICCILSLIGIVLCLIEAYGKRLVSILRLKGNT